MIAFLGFVVWHGSGRTAWRLCKTPYKVRVSEKYLSQNSILDPSVSTDWGQIKYF